MTIKLSPQVRETVLEWLAEQLETKPLDTVLIEVLCDHGWRQTVPYEAGHECFYCGGTTDDHADDCPQKAR